MIKAYKIVDWLILNSCNNLVLKMNNYFTLLAMAMIVCCQLFSCNATKDITSSGGEQVWLSGPEIYKDEAYAGISGNLPRLQAMLVGEFVQCYKDDEDGEYYPWLVNEGKDSIMIYALPAGDKNKVGHWIYYYQILTSLPDEPIYQAFFYLKALNRDTIKATYHEVPDNFKVSLRDVKKNTKSMFDQIDFKKLVEIPDNESVLYTRENPLHFKGESSYYKDPNQKDSYVKSYYDISPKDYNFTVQVFDNNKKIIPNKAAYNRFEKKAAILSK